MVRLLLIHWLRLSLFVVNDSLLHIFTLKTRVELLILHLLRKLIVLLCISSMGCSLFDFFLNIFFFSSLSLFLGSKLMEWFLIRLRDLLLILRITLWSRLSLNHNRCIPIVNWFASLESYSSTLNEFLHFYSYNWHLENLRH